MNAASAEAELIGLHDRFCKGFSERRPDLVLGTVADTSNLVVVTSEDAVLRGFDDLGAFLERYAAGATTYSWAWDRRNAATFDTWGCLLAVGTETASGESGMHLTPYRMTLVAAPYDDRWVLVQVHGSSPHHA